MADVWRPGELPRDPIKYTLADAWTRHLEEADLPVGTSDGA